MGKMRGRVLSFQIWPRIRFWPEFFLAHHLVCP